MSIEPRDAAAYSLESILGPLLILLLTIGLALLQPRVGPITIRRPAAALLGAVLSLASGVVPVPTAIATLRFLLEPVVTIVSLMTITLVAERAGLFRLLAVAIATVARGDGRRLFAAIFFTGAFAGALFTNDAVVLILTPVVLRLIDDVAQDSWLPKNKLPYYFAVLYTANLVGPLVISNPINILVAKLFNIGFLEYAAWMALPAAVSMLSTYVGLRIVFRRLIPLTYVVPAARAGSNGPSPTSRPAGGAAPAARLLNVAPHRASTTLPVLVLASTLLGFFLGEPLGIPTWLVASAGAAVLLGATAIQSRAGAVAVIRGIGWDVIGFVVCIFIITVGLRNAGVTTLLAELIADRAGTDLFALTQVVALTAGVLSAIMNNHPTANLMALAIADLSAHSPLELKLAALAALIGGDLGPKMLPTGSLAALLWLRLLAVRGVAVPYRLYIGIGIPITLVAIMLAVWTLNLEIAIMRQIGLLP